MTDARTVALADQAEAAGREADAMLAGVAGRLADAGEFVAGIGIHPFHHRLIDLMRSALRDAVAAGQPPTCEHVDLRKPAVGHWVTIDGQKLNCAGCANLAVQRAQGTERCALCWSRRELHCGGYRLPATALEWGDMAPIGAVMVIHWILCSGCLVAE